VGLSLNRKMDQGPITQIVSVQYNIPRYIIAEPGKQNRACTGAMRVTPGIWEPFEFQYTNGDGVPINLSGFTLSLLFWFSDTQYETLPANLQSNKVLLKQLHIEDVYAGKCTVCLSDQDTLTLGRSGRQSLRWSIYMSDAAEGTMFATQITQNGERWGMCHVDQSGMPSMEIVLGTSITP
jgi:hypothetical protein